MIDHVVIGARSLEEGIDWYEARTGLGAAPAGRHPVLGTCNAICPLADGTYVEILAPDADATARTPLTDLLAALTRPAPVTWAARSEDLAGVERRLRANGIRAERRPGARTTPDGREVRWTMLTVPHDLGATIPFFIQWETPSPATATTDAEMLRLTCLHPEPDRVESLLRALGLPQPVRAAAAPGLEVTVTTPRGEVHLGPNPPPGL